MKTKRTKEFNDTIRMYQIEEWEVKNETPMYVELQKQKDTIAGHILILIFTFWTLGIGNLIYHLVSNKKKKVFK